MAFFIISHMERLDSLFFSVFQYYKPKYKSKSNNIALCYILLLQFSIVVLLGNLLLFFLKQMHVDVFSTSKSLALLFIGILILIFRNWIYYTGKKRKVLNAKWSKSSSQKHHILLLWFIPIIITAFSILLSQRL